MDEEEITYLNVALNRSGLFKPPKATPRYEYNIKKQMDNSTVDKQ